MLEVWDTSAWANDANTVTPLDGIEDGLTGPAGLVYLDTDADPNLIEVLVTKTDDVISVSPNDTMTYTITIDPNGLDLGEVQVVDYLPSGVNFNPLISSNPPVIDSNYDSTRHRYIWTVDLTGAVVELTLTVTVNDDVEPLGTLINFVKVTSDTVYGQCYLQTPVDGFGGDVLYVDAQRPAGGSGTSWATAYRYLPDATARAAIMEGPCEIRIADGVYLPGESLADGFEIPDGASVYGGYAGVGAPDPDARNPKQYETVLSGYVNRYTRFDAVVTMGDETLLDGVTVTQAGDYGIYGNGADFTLENCTVENSEQWGIYALDGDITLEWCTVQNNGWHGIDHSGESYIAIIEACQVKNNQQIGIFTSNSTPTIKNCVVFENGSDTPIYYPGIRIYRPKNTPTIYNNTITSNRKEGISWSDNHNSSGDPNILDSPDIQNCILWYNNAGSDQVTGFNPGEFASYCCIQDCNEINYNRNFEPGFAYTTEPNHIPDPNNPYHLAWDSPCRNAGNLSFTTDDAGLYDIDAESRIINGRVDIGADELFSCDDDLSADDIYHPLDRNADGMVNLHEFSAFSAAWLSRDPDGYGDPNLADPNETAHWNAACNLDDTGDSQYVIDLADLDGFWDGWLWVACWKQSQMNRLETLMSAMMSAQESLLTAAPMTASFSVESALFEPLEVENPYTVMSTAEVVSLVQGIDEIIEFVDGSIEEDPENAENLLEIKEFLEKVLIEIDVSRQ